MTLKPYLAFDGKLQISQQLTTWKNSNNNGECYDEPPSPIVNRNSGKITIAKSHHMLAAVIVIVSIGDSSGNWHGNPNLEHLAFTPASGSTSLRHGKTYSSACSLLQVARRVYTVTESKRLEYRVSSRCETIRPCPSHKQHLSSYLSADAPLKGCRCAALHDWMTPHVHTGEPATSHTDIPQSTLNLLPSCTES